MTDQILTISCKLAPTHSQTTEIVATLERFADACTWINQVVPFNFKNSFHIHKLIYYQVREKFGLSANLAINAIKRVSANRKSNSVIERFDATSISYDIRIFMYREESEEVSLRLLNSRQRIKLILGNPQRSMLKGSKPTSATLCKRGSQYYINIQVKYEMPAKIRVNNVLGVDLGQKFLAVDNNGNSYSGLAIQKKRVQSDSLKSRLQASMGLSYNRPTRSAKKHLKKLSGRLSRFTRDTNHVISKKLVMKAKDTLSLISLEDLTGIRRRITAKTKSQRHNQSSWSFYQLREFLTYKAELVGVPVVLINPAYTSQECPICHCIEKANRPTRDSFRCTCCNFSGLADHIAAMNIAARVAVNLPIVSRFFAQMQAFPPCRESS